MGRSWRALNGMQVPVQGSGNVISVALTFAELDEHSIRVAFKVAYTRAGGWSYLKCHVLGMFGPKVEGSRVGDDGLNWKTLDPKHEGNVGEKVTEIVFATMPTADLAALASSDSAGFQLCHDVITLDASQRKSMLRFLGVAAVDSVAPSDG